MAASNYQIADTNELEALGQDDEYPAYDTSAALEPEDPDPQVYSDSSNPPKRRNCYIAVCIAFLIVAVGVISAIYFVFRPSADEPFDPNNVASYDVSVIQSTPHDPEAFIEGFEYSNGFFYESTGLTGQSSLRRVQVATGKVDKIYKFEDKSLFGEGITLHKDEHIFMLTWQSGRGFVFDQNSFNVKEEFSFKGEGWGLTMDREKDEVYMSDGTTELRVLDPKDLSEKRRIKVTLRGETVRNINELEWICGEIWANVWQTKDIYRIDPTTGYVRSIIKAHNLPLPEDLKTSKDVLNGIAFDRDSGRVWLTGKQWSKVYQVNVEDPSLRLKNCK